MTVTLDVAGIILAVSGFVLVGLVAAVVWFMRGIHADFKVVASEVIAHDKHLGIFDLRVGRLEREFDMLERHVNDLSGFLHEEGFRKRESGK